MFCRSQESVRIAEKHNRMGGADWHGWENRARALSMGRENEWDWEQGIGGLDRGETRACRCAKAAVERALVVRRGESAWSMQRVTRQLWLVLLEAQYYGFGIFFLLVSWSGSLWLFRIVPSVLDVCW